MSLSAAQWAQVEEIFADAVALAPAQRVLELDRATDPVVRNEVAALLAAADDAGDFLSRSATVITVITADPMASLAADARLGPWRVLRLIGRGGMGEVYEAQRADGQFEQRAAIKLLWHISTPLLRLFQAERQILARLDHPGISRLLDGGVTSTGQPYAVMEYVVGEAITDWCRGRSSPLAERLRLFLQICEAVTHAHKNLIVHRDLKPANILVDAEGRVRLLDFGIAKLLDVPESESVPSVNAFTPDYAAPEQLAGGPITTATDVHALGLLLFELVTGRRANAAGAKEERPARGLLDGDLEAIIATCLRKEPDRRYSSVDLLRLDVERAQNGEAVSTRAGERFYALRRFVRRHAVPLAASAAALLLLVAFAATLAVQLRAVSRERDRANHQAETARRVTRFMTDMFKAADPRESRGAQTTARELLDRAATRVEKELSAEPALQAELMAVMAEVYGILGSRQDVARLSKAALAIRERVLGPDAEATLESQTAWVDVLRSQGRCREATAEARKTQEAAARTLGPEHALTLQARWLVAVSLICDGRGAEAIPLLRELVVARRQRFGPDQPPTLTALNALASALTDEGQLQEAVVLFEEVLQSRRRVLGGDHPDTLDSMTDLEWTHLELGQYAEAEALLAESLPAFERVLGPEHPKTLKARRTLGQVRAGQGRFREAEQIFLGVLQTQRRTLPADHPYIVGTLLALARTYALQGRYAEQKKIHLEALEIERRARHQPSGYALEILYALGADASLEGDSAAALGWLRELADLGMPGDLARKLRLDPELDPLRALPAFAAIAAKAPPTP